MKNCLNYWISLFLNAFQFPLFFLQTATTHTIAKLFLFQKFPCFTSSNSSRISDIDQNTCTSRFALLLKSLSLLELQHLITSLTNCVTFVKWVKVTRNFCNEVSATFFLILVFRSSRNVETCFWIPKFFCQKFLCISQRSRTKLRFKIKPVKLPRSNE